MSELRIDYGPGYRLYFTQRADDWVVLLIGGDKKTQRQDIHAAIELANKIWENKISETKLWLPGETIFTRLCRSYSQHDRILAVRLNLCLIWFKRLLGQYL